MTRRIPLLLTCLLALTGCPAESTRPLPAAPAARPTASPSPAPEPANFAVRGTVSLLGMPVAGAAIRIVQPVSGQVLATGLATDADGAFAVTVLAGPLGRGPLLVVATTGGTDLFGLLEPGDGYATTVVDLASTVTVKRGLLAWLDVVLTHSGTPAADQRMAALAEASDRLRHAVADALAAPSAHGVLDRAIHSARLEKSNLAIDRLSDAVIEYSAARPAFTSLIEAVHAAVVSNLQEGGPVRSPVDVRVGSVVIPAPRVARLDPGTLAVTRQGQTVALASTAGPVTTAPWVTDLILHNARLVASGGSGGGGVGAPEPILSGVSL